MSASIRENVILDSAFEQERYDDALSRAGLDHDISLFPDGDRTEIGEKGVTLSGGQRQRVSLARVLYSRAPIVVLDDPLSAIDPGLATHILDQAIVPLSMSALVIMTSHAPHLVDAEIPGVTLWRLTEEKSLTMVYSGTNIRTPDSPGIAPALLFSESGESGLEEDEDNTNNAEGGSNALSSGPPKAVISKEDRATGSVQWRHYLAYGRALGWLSVGAIGLGLLLARAFSVWRDMWLAEWTNQAEKDPQVNNGKYLGGYFGLIVATSVAEAGTNVLVVVASAVAGSKYHRGALGGVVGSPMAFFDATPLGRILNRFSKDMATMDSGVLSMLVTVAMTLIKLMAILVVIGSAIPWFLLAAPLIGLIYYPIAVLFQVSKRELQRTSSTVASPVFAHVTASIDGLSSVRAYSLSESFMARHVQNIDRVARVWLGKVGSNRWFFLRLALLGAAVVTFSAILAVSSVARGSITSATAGLCLLYASQLTSGLVRLVAALTKIEVQMNSVERLGYYIGLPQEEEAVDREAGARLDWGPSEGAIELQNVSLRYREDLPLVLNGVTLRIEGGSKVGIAGPSGSGKSTLISTLFRTTPLASGSVSIDGMDTADVSLHELRSALAIIPQDAHLFTGSLRFNLDPREERSDAEIWHALTSVGMADKVESRGEGLEVVVKGNFSVGEAQLLCMARALLRSAQIIVIDEGTASVDAESDAVIQQVIRSVFAACTVLTIAHRVHTIMDYDRVVVLEDGVVVRDGVPGDVL